MSPYRLTGWRLYLPGIDIAAALARQLRPPVGGWVRDTSPEPAGASAILGRRGLLGVEPATRMALCAVHRALGLPDGARPRRPASPDVAVVVCGNLGNLDTVAAVARAVADGGARAVSVLDAPNVSSNVVAGTVARWFGFGGANLTVCSGSAAGRHGLWLAGLLLRGGRARRVVLVGVEPADETATALYLAGYPHRRLCAGAACVVLEHASPARRAVTEVVPRAGAPTQRAAVTVGPTGFDPVGHWGDCYGARDVVALALAAHLAGDEGYGAVAVDLTGGERVLVRTAGGGR